MTYVDGYLLPIAKRNISRYRRMAQIAGAVWRDHGALDYKECRADQPAIKGFASFLKIIGAKNSETVVFAFVVFKSRKHRDLVNARVMKDPRLAAMCGNQNMMPFDVHRMAYGGFSVLVDAAPTKVKHRASKRAPRRRTSSAR